MIEEGFFDSRPSVQPAKQLKGSMIRQEIQWVVDDAGDPSKFKNYSSHGGSFQHRESGLVIASTWLGVPGFGSVKEHIELTPEELVFVGHAYMLLRQAYDAAQQAKTWENVKGRFKKRAQSVYRFITSKTV